MMLGFSQAPSVFSQMNDHIKKAVALAYQADLGAPRVVATGSGLIADAIIQKAKDNGVFVHESRELVALLSGLDLDDEIPPQLYRAVAELLAWLYQMEKTTLTPPASDTS